MDNSEYSDGMEIEKALCPVEDCNLTVDLKLRSSDGVLFGAHQFNLEHYSAGFPPAAAITVDDSEVTPLPEKENVLRLMLQYMHNSRQPDLFLISFKLLSSLSEAVEKYMIFSAMEVCRVHMGLGLNDHPIEVFLYSAKHDYPRLSNEAARMTLAVPTTKFKTQAQAFGLNDSLIYQWYRYREQWVDLLQQHVFNSPPTVQHKGGYSSCDDWDKFYNSVAMKVGRNFDALGKFNETLGEFRHMLQGCSYCGIRNTIWSKRVETAISNLSPFSES